MSEQQTGPAFRPVYPAIPIASIGAAMLAVIGIVAALLEREATGVGCEVETSLVDGALSFLNIFWEGIGSSPDDDAPADAVDRSRYRLLGGRHRCADGQLVGIHTGANGSHARLMEALGLSDRVRPARGSREKLEPLTEEEASVIATEVPRIFASRPLDHWLKVLSEADVTAIPVLRQTEAFDTEQTRHIGMVVEVADDALGVVEQVGIPARFSRSPGHVRGRAPRLGEHTDAVLEALQVSETTAQFVANVEDGCAAC